MITEDGAPGLIEGNLPTLFIFLNAEAEMIAALARIVECLEIRPGRCKPKAIPEITTIFRKNRLSEVRRNALGKKTATGLDNKGQWPKWISNNNW